MVKTRHAAVGAPIVPVAWEPRRATDEVEVLRLADIARLVPRNAAERVEFHIFALYVEGRSAHEVDFEAHACRSGTLVHVRPGQVHRFDLRAGVDGFAMVVAPTFLLPKRSRDAWHEGFFDDVAWPAALALGADDRAWLIAAFERLRDVAAAVDGTPVTLALLRHLLAATLLDVARRAGLGAAPARGRPEDPGKARALRAAIERSFRVTRTVEDYAERLGCSARTLDRLARSAAGGSAKAMIDARVVLEARRLLVHTSESVAAIGEELGFSEATNFVKFYRARTGEPPGAFRARHARIETSPKTPRTRR